MITSDSLQNTGADIFDILGITSREDCFTNLLKYRYDESVDFRMNFLKLIFGDGSINENIEFSVRHTYPDKTSEKDKITPDIVLHSTNYFAIVEVKIYAGEGIDQTQRYYDNRNDIMEILGVDINAKQVYKFLTLHGITSGCDKFNPISWTQIGKCLPDMNYDEVHYDTDLLIYQLKKRCESITKININLNDKWYECTRPDKWSGAVGLSSALSKLFPEECYKNRDYWGSYKKTEAKYSLSASFGKKKWLSEYTYNDLSQTVSPCYMIHFEFEWHEPELEVRLDYHLNPYISSSDYKKTDMKFQPRIDMCNEQKMLVARSCKKSWNQNYSNELPNDFSYNGHIGKDLMRLIRSKKTIKKQSTCKDVIGMLRPFVKAATRFVDKELIPAILAQK